MAISIRPQNTITWRLGALSSLIALLYGLLLIRLVYLQVVRGDYYRSEALTMRSREIPLPARRGAILDREGKPLAVTTYPVAVVVDPEMILDPPKTASLVAKVTGLDAAEVLPKLVKGLTSQKKKIRYSLIRRGLSPAVEDTLEQLRQDAANHDHLAAVAVVPEPKRSYPGGRTVVHAVGVTGETKSGREGLTGFERQHNVQLAGSPGRMVAEVDDRRRVIAGTQQRLSDAKDGADLRTTIDSYVQRIASSALADCVKRFNPKGATVIVVDPRTGDVLSMVSYPDYDPDNRPKRGWNPESLRNRPLDLYEPGSTMKPVTVVTALDQGAISTTTTFTCPGYMQEGKRIIRCSLHGDDVGRGHGTQNYVGVLAKSCNIGTAMMAKRLGAARWEAGFDRFGLHEPTGVGLPRDFRGRFGFGIDDHIKGTAQLTRAAFGQAVLVSPLSLLMCYAAIANGGVRMQPRLLLAEQGSEGEVLRRFAPVELGLVAKPKVVEMVRAALENVCIAGTGKSAKPIGYTTAGKTGSAQKVEHKARGYSGDKYVSSFYGFVPARSPRAAICVVVDEPKGSHLGAVVAAPVFKKIARQLMWYWKVSPDESEKSPVHLVRS